MTENPYTSTPTSFLTAPTASESNDETLQNIARRVFLAWEKLRAVYVLVLAVETILITGMSGLFSWRLLILILVCAVVANIAFFAGPTIETYICWLGYKRLWPRWAMFFGGTLISIVLALAVLASELLPNQL